MDDENNLPDLSKFYGGDQMGPNPSDSAMSISAARAMMEVQGQIVMAKKFPRNEIEAIKRIERACSRIELAKKASYSFPKGKDADTGRSKTVSGPSIRLAETLAQCWGNMDSGVRELSNDEIKKESVMEAYCWDLETNNRVAKMFTVKHGIKTRNGFKEFDDPRDIYEIGANMGSRRMRSCILAIIPADVVSHAEKACRNTIQGDTSKPFADRVRDLCIALDKAHQVTLEHIEEFLGYSVDKMSHDDFVELYNIYNSLSDKITKRDSWFGKKEAEPSSATENLNNLADGVAGLVAVGQKTDVEKLMLLESEKLKSKTMSVKNTTLTEQEANSFTLKT